jgi:DNA modification methylase
MSPRVERIGDATLYLGDCREILPTLGRFDACVTDPPYGINAARDRNSQQWGWRDFPASGWDKERASRAAIFALLDAAPNAVIWGGNYFTDALPPSGKWLIWDKCQSDFSLADAELAWCSFSGAVRRISYPRARALQDGKVHPTQKPIAVMEWCLAQLPSGCRAIVDPYMGSGTTGVACARRGMNFTGIEAEAVFFDIACRRIEQATRQGDMLRDIPPAPKPEQKALDLGGAA